MPLIKSSLEQKLKSRILALEPKLYDALKKKTTGLYKAQLLVDQKISDTPPSSGFDIYKFKNKLWQANADEWGKVIAKEVIKLLAEDISGIIADEMDTFIKSATIITLPGQQVVTATPAGPGSGATTTPSSPNKIS